MLGELLGLRVEDVDAVWQISGVACDDNPPIGRDDEIEDQVFDRSDGFASGCDAPAVRKIEAFPDT